MTQSQSLDTQLARTETRDGLRLDGVLQRPRSGPARAGVDAAVLLSGVGSNFYGSDLMEHLAHRLCAVGMIALRVNTRGHDGVSTARTASGGRLQGAAHEIVDDCRADLSAWVEFLVQRGARRVCLLGHSLGAIKVIYSQAHDPRPEVAGVIGISPPRLSHARFLRSAKAAAFQRSMLQAETHVREGAPDTLFRASFPYPLVISAATFLDKYGPAERYNILRFANEVACPMLLTFGQRELSEDNVAFHRIVDDVQALPWRARPRIEVVPEANHNYSEQFDSLSTCVQRFLDEPEPYRDE